MSARKGVSRAWFGRGSEYQCRSALGFWMSVTVVDGERTIRNPILFGITSLSTQQAQTRLALTLISPNAWNFFPRPCPPHQTHFAAFEEIFPTRSPDHRSLDLRPDLTLIDRTRSRPTHFLSLHTFRTRQIAVERGTAWCS
jgi:hypothetical protein